MIGTILSNRYKITAELGSGGMAWVYLAEDLREKQRVAIKILYPQHSQDLAFLQRFMQEAKLAMSLSQCAPQQQIVCVLDYGSDQDTHYLVMEFVPGRDLGQILEERGPLPWQEALSIGRQVAQALAHANRYDIVHRDIKPGNIMILPDGSVRVLDFGIARAKSSPELTLSGFVGSPNYAAPEQAMGEAVDTRADIYSLGVVMYRMLSGNLPFEGKTPWAVVNQHIASPPPPLERVRSDLPDSVIQLVQKALSKRPDDRFQTPEEMVEAIETVLSGHDLPLEVTPTGENNSTVQLETLYRQAQRAAKAGAWQQAIDLFSQILKINPDYRDVTQQLAEAGMQIRLGSLYRSARRALQLGQWDHAIEQIDKIQELDASYRDIRELRAKAEKKEALEEDEDKPKEFPTQAGALSPALAAREKAEDIPEQQKIVQPESDRQNRLLWLLVAALVIVVVAGAFLLFQGQPSPLAAATATATESATPTQTASPTKQPSATNTPLAARTVVLSPTPSPSPTITTTLTPSPTTTAILATLTSQAPTEEPPLTGRIAFPRFNSAVGTYDVYVCQVDGDNCQRVASEISQPDFLPDGSQLVVHSWKSDDKGLTLLSLSGRLIWKITDTIESARPSVDFQGQLYAYHSREEADRQARLYRTYDAETRPIQREGNTVLGLSPSWLPNGQLLYSGCLRDTCGIIAMRADGSAPRQVTAGANEANPEASPDGRHVVFMSQRDGNWEVYVVNVDGSNLRRLTRNPANDGLPTWSPDGRDIAFVSDRDGGWAIWTMRADGSDQRKLFEIGGPLDGRVRDTAPHETHGWVEERITWAP